MRVYLLILALIPFSVLGTSKAFATDAYQYTFNCGYPSGAAIPANQAVSCGGSSNDPTVTDYYVNITSPDGHNGIAYPGNTGLNYRNGLITIGLWQFNVYFLDSQGNTVQHVYYTLNTTIFVLPESPMGAIALLGASSAGMAAFLILRQRKQL